MGRVAFPYSLCHRIAAHLSAKSGLAAYPRRRSTKTNHDPSTDLGQAPQVTAVADHSNHGAFGGQYIDSDLLLFLSNYAQLAHRKDDHSTMALLPRTTSSDAAN